MPITCHIDFSVLLASGVVYGSVAGVLELPSVPRMGESISFLFPGNETMPLVIPDYSGIRRVTNVIYNSGDPSAPVLLSLEDITLTTSAEVGELFQYFKDAYGLHGSHYGR